MVVDLERRYEDVDAGLADLSAVVVARRYGTRRLLTFDERHFRNPAAARWRPLHVAARRHASELNGLIEQPAHLSFARS